METSIITGGKLCRLGIERPSSDQVVRLAASARANGFGLAGSGSIRKVTGSKVSIIVGPSGCTCPLWRSDTYCHHMALYAIESATVAIDEREPVSITRYRERRSQRGYGRPRRHLWSVRPVVAFRRSGAR